MIAAFIWELTVLVGKYHLSAIFVIIPVDREEQGGERSRVGRRGRVGGLVMFFSEFVI